MFEAKMESELALGKVNYKLYKRQKNARNYRRALYFAKTVKKGDVVTKINLKSFRHGYGTHPKYLPDLIKKHLTKDCEVRTSERDILFK